MGLGSFRVRLIAAVAMLLLIWQSVRIWSVNYSTFFEEVEDEAENGGSLTGIKIQKVLVGVYYEALCPDSRSFVIKQLKPTYEALNESIDIQMIPYGKATTTKTDSGYEFTCQHGVVECQANTIHACAIDVLKDPTVRLDFLACMIKNNVDPINITKVCAKKMRIDEKPILECQMGFRGQELEAMYGRMTDALRPQVKFIPTVTLDKNSDNQAAILKNLLEQVCQRFKVLPKGCTS